jgi:hypothetical protein
VSAVKDWGLKNLVDDFEKFVSAGRERDKSEKKIWVKK